MSVGSRQRFCESCQKPVHDLSEMTRKHAEGLLKASPQGLCGRITRDGSGAIVFRPEPPSRVRRSLGTALLGISACAARAQASDVKSCPVELRIADTTDTAITGAQATFLPADNTQPLAQSVTDSTGFIHQQLEPGRYRVEAGAPGFHGATRDVDVRCGDQPPTYIDVQLEVGQVGQIIEVRPGSGNPLARAWYWSRDLVWRLRHSM